MFKKRDEIKLTKNEFAAAICATMAIVRAENPFSPEVSDATEGAIAKLHSSLGLPEGYCGDHDGWSRKFDSVRHWFE